MPVIEETVLLAHLHWPCLDSTLFHWLRLVRFESYELDGKEEPYNATKLLEFLEQQSSFDLFSTFDVVVKAGPGPMGASSNDVLPVYPYSILPTTWIRDGEWSWRPALQGVVNVGEGTVSAIRSRRSFFFLHEGSEGPWGESPCTVERKTNGVKSSPSQHSGWT